MYLLDTNIISYLQKGNPQIIQKIKSLDSSQLSISSITVSELFFGAINNPSQNRGKVQLNYYTELIDKTEVYSFDTKSSIIFATLKTGLWTTGSIIEDTDLQIASIAIANDLTLVTNNTKHFKNIPNLKTEDWSK